MTGEEIPGYTHQGVGIGHIKNGEEVFGVGGDLLLDITQGVHERPLLRRLNVGIYFIFFNFSLCAHSYQLTNSASC